MNPDADDDDDVEEDLETALARELKELKKPRQGSRFGTCIQLTYCIDTFLLGPLP